MSRKRLGKTARSKPTKAAIARRRKRARSKLAGAALPELGQDRPNSAKNHRTIVPAPQRARILYRYAAGQSIRLIAREEKRDRATVRKLVEWGSPEMQSYVRDLRERFFALGLDALAAVEHAMRHDKNAVIGYRLLVDIGAIPPRELLGAVQPAPAEDDHEKRVRELCVKLLRVGVERARIYGTRFPELEQGLTPEEVKELYGQPENKS